MNQTSGRKKPSSAARSIRRLTLTAVIAALALVGGVGGWAATAKLAGAVIGHGTVVVEGSVKRIQHLDGGIVGEIRVKDGERVKAGDVLIRLNATLAKANLATISGQMDQFTARRMRLVAESEDLAEVTIPDEFLARAGEQRLGGYIETETALFHARKRTLEGQKAQLGERIGQIARQTDGLNVRQSAKSQELNWIDQELGRTRSLSDQKLIQFTRLAELERVKAQLEGERGQILTEKARSEAQVTETRLQILQLDKDRQTEVLTELRDVDNKMAELAERRIAAQDQLSRIDIVSPQDGVVHELQVHTVGGVITPGQVIMQIVPIHESLIVEARIMPSDIDQLSVGQQAELRFSAFNQQTTPQIKGTISTVAADLTFNTQTGEAWYTTRIRIAPQELKRLGGLVILAGMPVETFVQTGERSALSYLMKPVTDQFERAMREE